MYYKDGEGHSERGAYLDIKTPGFDLGEVENIINNRQQGIARTENVFSVFSLLLIQVNIKQQLSHAYTTN